MLFKEFELITLTNAGNWIDCSSQSPENGGRGGRERRLKRGGGEEGGGNSVSCVRRTVMSEIEIGGDRVADGGGSKGGSLRVYCLLCKMRLPDAVLFVIDWLCLEN